MPTTRASASSPSSSGRAKVSSATVLRPFGGPGASVPTRREASARRSGGGRDRRGGPDCTCLDAMPSPAPRPYGWVEAVRPTHRCAQGRGYDRRCQTARMTTDLLRSPLHDRHVALGAKLADFGGWEMPIEYGASGGGVLREHAAVREAVGVFDVSHLGKARVRGTGAADFVNSTLSNDLGRIGPGQAQYTLCCDQATGGVVDDLIAYLFAEDHVFLIPNAANTAEVVRRLAAAAPAGVTVTDEHHDF